MRIGLVVPHMFMQRDILPQVIFSPAGLALDLAEGIQAHGGTAVTLFSPGPVDTTVQNVTADLGLFEAELQGRGYSYIELLKKHPMTFVSLARQVQAELIATAFAMANRGDLDIVHIYTNEEDIALPFAQLCQRPVVFTHHDPFNFLIRYKNTFPKYKHLNWISLSHAQRRGMPQGTNWVANIYHGLNDRQWQPHYTPAGNYLAYVGRIVESKGVHLAIAAVKQYNRTAARPYALRITGKHYAGSKDRYWQERIAPHIDGREIIYEGFTSDLHQRQEFIGNAAAVLMPSLFDEPFGMVAIEALACGTPVVGLGNGALPEIIQNGQNGWIVPAPTEPAVVRGLAEAIGNIAGIQRHICRQTFEQRFTARRMCQEHIALYRALAQR